VLPRQFAPLPLLIRQDQEVRCAWVHDSPSFPSPIHDDGTHPRTERAGRHPATDPKFPAFAFRRQPAATGTGFSIGTPMRLPYSVQLPS
jgi:hypothetical protein